MRPARPGLLAALSLSTLLLPAAVAGQFSPLVIEARVGATRPIASFARDGDGRLGEGAARGASFGVAFWITPATVRSFTLGFSQHRFACEGAGCPSGGSYVSTGIDFGVRRNLRLGNRVAPWIRLGVRTARTELGGLPGAGGPQTSLGIGGEVGVGLYLRVSEALGLNPGVRVSALNGDFPAGGVLRSRYLVGDVGLAWSF